MIKTGFIAAALLAGGCTVGPDYHPPEMETPGSYSELPSSAEQAPFSVPVANEPDLSRWWLQFGDAELQKLIARALQSNLDLLTAASRVREAREQEIIAGSPGWPQVDADGLAAATRLGSHASSGAGVAPSLDSNFFLAGFDASWELDLFGGNTRRVQAALASTEAAIWRMRDGEVALTAEIATAYMKLRATQEHIVILRAEIKAQQSLLAMIKARAGAGFVTELDVNQQSSLADSTAARIPELEGYVRILERAIAVLLAEQTDATVVELDSTAPIPTIPSSLPVGLPSDLLRRRPDIREAERDLGAATAEVGVATSSLYPKFDLMGGIGLTGSIGSQLMHGGNFGQIGLGSITWPILNWGQTKANVRTKEEEAKQAYYVYQKTILAAVQNTEDALSRYKAEQQRLVALERAEAAVRASTAIAAQQFRVGAVTYVNVLVAQANELTVRDQMVEGRQIFATDLISLYKALGGGWAADIRDDTMAVRAGRDADENLNSDLNATTAGQIVDGNHAGLKLAPLSTQATVDCLRPASNEVENVVGAILQLGAWRSQAAAAEGWEHAKRRAGDLLNGLNPRIVMVDLSGKGRYYRLRTTLPKSMNPTALCQALKDEGLECIVALRR